MLHCESSSVMGHFFDFRCFFHIFFCYANVFVVVDGSKLSLDARISPHAKTLTPIRDSG